MNSNDKTNDLRRINELRRRAKQAFEAMKAAELKMDDMDILTESPLYRRAMEAAAEWHRLEDQIERAQRWDAGAK